MSEPLKGRSGGADPEEIQLPLSYILWRKRLMEEYEEADREKAQPSHLGDSSGSLNDA